MLKPIRLHWQMFSTFRYLRTHVCAEWTAPINLTKHDVQAIFCRLRDNSGSSRRNTMASKVLDQTRMSSNHNRLGYGFQWTFWWTPDRRGWISYERPHGWPARDHKLHHLPILGNHTLHDRSNRQCGWWVSRLMIWRFANLGVNAS